MLFSPQILALRPKTTAAAATDPSFASVKLLCHFDNNLTDNSSVGATLTAVGNAGASATQSKFGGYSLGLDGTGDYVTIPYVTGNYDWFAGAYTIECWVYYNSFTNASNGGFPGLIGNLDQAGANYWSFGANTSGNLRFYQAAGVDFGSTGTLSTSTWTHIAMGYDGTTVRLFINGTKDGEVTKTGSDLSSATQPLTIGSWNGSALNAYVDDIRITKGVCRYTGNFTAPTAAFPNS